MGMLIRLMVKPGEPKPEWLRGPGLGNKNAIRATHIDLSDRHPIITLIESMRVECGMSQREIAELANQCINWWNSVMTRPSTSLHLDRLERILDHFGYELAVVRKDTDEVITNVQNLDTTKAGEQDVRREQHHNDLRSTAAE